jgi:glutathione S-transferase
MQGANVSPIASDLFASTVLRKREIMLLYNTQVSGNCYKVRLLLAHLGLEYDLYEVDAVDRTALAKDVLDYSDRTDLLEDLNPALRIPVVVLDDGRPLGESNAILCYLAEETPYLPKDRFERAKVFQWLFFEQSSHAPYIAGAYLLVAHWHGPTGPLLDAEIEARHTRGYSALDAMEKHLASRQFLVAERYTIADVALYAYTHLAPEGGFELSEYPAVRGWLERVAAQPGYLPITE